MSKIKKVPTDGVGGHQFLFWCEGCQYEHAISPEVHAFNGDLENPIVSPSILDKARYGGICHSMIYNGRIRYFQDCHHAFRGKDVELLDVDQMIEIRKQAAKN